MPCRHCNRPISKSLATGYIHHEHGGGRIWYQCDMCNWGWATVTAPEKCPECGEVGVREDHMAEPKESEVRV